MIFDRPKVASKASGLPGFLSSASRSSVASYHRDIGFSYDVLSMSSFRLDISQTGLDHVPQFPERRQKGRLITLRSHAAARQDKATTRRRGNEATSQAPSFAFFLLPSDPPTEYNFTICFHSLLDALFRSAVFPFFSRYSGCASLSRPFWLRLRRQPRVPAPAHNPKYQAPIENVASIGLHIQRTASFFDSFSLLSVGSRFTWSSTRICIASQARQTGHSIFELAKSSNRRARLQFSSV